VIRQDRPKREDITLPPSIAAFFARMAASVDSTGQTQSSFSTSDSRTNVQAPEMRQDRITRSDAMTNANSYHTAIAKFTSSITSAASDSASAQVRGSDPWGTAPGVAGGVLGAVIGGGAGGIGTSAAGTHGQKHVLAYARPMPADDSPPRRVKLFRNGRNQSVRIPREFQLPGEDALMRKDGLRLIIGPVGATSLVALLKTLSPIDDDFAPVAELPTDSIHL
jgi:antitoxin VapB